MSLQHLRLTLSLTGMLLAVAGVALDERLLIWAAIGVLGMSVVVRLIMGRRSRTSSPPHEDDRAAS